MPPHPNHTKGFNAVPVTHTAFQLLMIVETTLFDRDVWFDGQPSEIGTWDFDLKAAPKVGDQIQDNGIVMEIVEIAYWSPATAELGAVVCYVV